MLNLKQGTAAIALVVSLGLIAPGSLGGSALADVKPPPNDNVRNPQYVETVFNCDLDGVEGYETPYELVSTFGAKMWQDKNSTTVLVQRLRVDVIDSYYEVLDDPTGTAVDFADPDVYWFDGPQDYPNGKPKGWQTVRCTEVVSYEYTATAEDAALAHLSFVEGVTYIETDTNLYDVTIGGNGPKAKSASPDGAPSADRQVKAKKQARHRGKGKRRG